MFSRPFSRQRTLLPNITQADQPLSKSLFRDSTAARGAFDPRSHVKPADAQWAEVHKRRIGAVFHHTALATTESCPHRAGPLHRSESGFTGPSCLAFRAGTGKTKASREQGVNVGAKMMLRQGGSQVRLVTQLGQLDPFDDPFGDRDAQFQEPRGRTFISQADDSPPRPGVAPEPSMQPDDSEFAPFRDDVPAPSPQPGDSEFSPFSDDAPAPSPQRGDTEFSPFRDDAPRPAPLDDLTPQPSPFSDDTLPAPPSETEDDRFRDPVIPPRRYQHAADCDKIYNERDCCTDAEECKKARRYVRQNTIDKISLNISPSFKPDATTDAEVEQARTLKLAQSAIRSWRNRNGEVVARGQVTNLQFGRVHIEHEGKVEKIPVRELSDDDWCFLAAWWGVPTECSLGEDKFENREWLASTMTWKASGLCHKPLYFEEVQLERYGHTIGPVLQPAVSGAHFFLNIATLPYKMGISPPHECEYALGYYRPGNCAPWLLPPASAQRPRRIDAGGCNHRRHLRDSLTRVLLGSDWSKSSETPYVSLLSRFLV